MKINLKSWVKMAVWSTLLVAVFVIPALKYSPILGGITIGILIGNWLEVLIFWYCKHKNIKIEVE